MNGLLDVILSKPPWEARLIRVSGFPIPQSELTEVKKILDTLFIAPATRKDLHSLVFLQSRELNRAGITRRLTEQARKWVPKIGLGVWPDREPPALWTAEQFADLGPGEAPPALVNHVFRVTASPAAAEDAWKSLLGFGSLVRVITSGTAKEYLDRARSVFLPSIVHPAFRSLPYYIPLLDSKSITSSHANLENWLSGASIYLRESFEDSGILIISSQSLSGAWRDQGTGLDRSDSDGQSEDR